MDSKIIEEIKDLLVDLSDEIDMHDYRDGWEEKSQALITRIMKLLRK